MGTFHSDWMFSNADRNIKTNPKGRFYKYKTFCSIFKCMRVNWSNIIVTGILGMTNVMPEIAKVSIYYEQ